jgi:reversibly glycosylated polypeptide/UDP-arabinopyranose mutase
MSNIAVVVPSIRPESMKTFMKAWQPLFDKHGVELVVVKDGETPIVQTFDDVVYGSADADASEIMGEYASCLTNFNAGIRNLGFAYVAKYLPRVKMIITLDDDEVPIGDPIQDHIDVLSRRVPVSWISTAVDDYTRGFPYGIREEAEVVLSHGVWEGVADWDAPTQLVRGSHYPAEFYKGPIPKGIFYPMCSMNLAFKVCMLPYIFHAPWALGINRFDDIFAGIVSKREIDKHGWAAVTGYARVHHERASNTFTNLKHEAPGIELLETYWQGDESHSYFRIYKEKLKTWQSFLMTLR